MQNIYEKLIELLTTRTNENKQNWVQVSVSDSETPAEIKKYKDIIKLFKTDVSDSQKFYICSYYDDFSPMGTISPREDIFCLATGMYDGQLVLQKIDSGNVPIDQLQTLLNTIVSKQPKLDVTNLMNLLKE